jgi:hypothetical protein
LLLGQQADIRSEWVALRSQLSASASALGGAVRGISQRPDDGRALDEPSIHISRGEWITLDDAVRDTRENLHRLEGRAVPAAGEATANEREALVEVESRLQRLGAVAADTLRTFELEQATATESSLTLAGIESDIRRHQDIRVLRELGSDTADLLRHDCPTCHKARNIGLLDPVEVDQGVGDIDTNIAVLEARRTLFRTLIDESQKSVAVRQAELVALRAESHSLQARIRALKDSLSSRSDAPSSAEIEARLSFSMLLGSLQTLRDDWAAALERFVTLKERADAVATELKNLRNDALSSDDHAKLQRLERSFQAQLRLYGFQSCPVDQVILSIDNYLPTNEGFEVSNDISASDTIRMIWAYLLGLLEIGQRFPTSHPGVVVFDEPKQQAAAEYSLAALLKHSADVATNGGQVLFATSEEASNLDAMLNGLDANLRSFQTKILAPL